MLLSLNTEPMKRVLLAPEAGEGAVRVPSVSTFCLLHHQYQTTGLSVQHPLGALGKLWEWCTNVPSIPDSRGCYGISEGEPKMLNTLQFIESPGEKVFHPRCHCGPPMRNLQL